MWEQYGLNKNWPLYYDSLYTWTNFKLDKVMTHLKTPGPTCEELRGSSCMVSDYVLLATRKIGLGSQLAIAAMTTGPLITAGSLENQIPDLSHHGLGELRL